MSLWSLVLDVVVFAAAIVAILDYFGIKPKAGIGGIAMPLSRRWKLAMMLGLMAVSLGLSGYGFYRSLHPQIIEKIVEKPIERIAPCPEQKAAGVTPIPAEKVMKKPDHLETNPITQPKPKEGQNRSAPSTVINAQNGIGISGGEVTNPTVNNYGPPQRTIEGTDREQLISVLSKHPGSVEFGTLGTDPASESYKFTETLRDIFEAAGWTVSKRITPMAASGVPAELTITYKTFPFAPSPHAPPSLTPIVIALKKYAHVKAVTPEARDDWNDSLLLVVGPNPATR
jgi:hypothetical protein